MTCEANKVIQLAAEVKQNSASTTIVGGIHASNDPNFFNQEMIDYVVIGLGQKSLRELVDSIEANQLDEITQGAIPGVARTQPGRKMIWTPRQFYTEDYATEPVPSYELTTAYRDSYFLPKLKVNMGYVVTAYGCPYNCSFCSIAGQAGGKYICQPINNVVRDLQALPDAPFVRLVDANTFGSIEHARQLCQAIKSAGIQKSYLVDVRADTVVNHPDVIEQWQQIGLRSVVIGCEEISDKRLTAMNKKGSSTINNEALTILHQLGITVVGDFIVDPDYDDNDFDLLEDYILNHKIDLPMLTIMTPLPGTELYRKMSNKINEFNLDYYTLTNAVSSTRLSEKRFYRRYTDLMQSCHHQAKI
jgi:radical SAM superfamily enzyme YgiQ (UPF0313 family)